MLSAMFWFFVFFVVVFAAMRLRARMQHDEGMRAWYERLLKDRIDLLKKIVIYGTIVLWAGIWMATRGEDKASIGSLLREISNSWSKQEIQNPPTIE
ncbi:MAG: hypothetical protein HQ513_18890 [Rhodospirillales bacterium]|nr:hypothetical protein [Rhodospirillales bacterium]